jgi:hypothetical protein
MKAIEKQPCSASQPASLPMEPIPRFYPTGKASSSLVDHTTRANLVSILTHQIEHTTMKLPDM